MYCSYCHAICGSSDHYCHACGSQLRHTAGEKGSRWFPLLLLILMSAAGLAAFFATSGNKVTDADNPWFYMKNGILYFEADRYTGGSELNIPAELDGHPVTALSDDCFAGCENLTAIFLPDTVTAIGDGAFYRCTSLRGIYIPTSVHTIGKEAFLGCRSLESICLHNTVISIGFSAFDQCSHLKYIIFRGRHDQWNHLYDGDINAFVGVFCEDGTFFQSEDGLR